MEMGEKIHKLRLEKDLTLEELGNKVGVGKSTVRKWENGMIANMKRDKILKLSDALDTTPSYLMGWDEKKDEQYYLNDETTKMAQDIFENKELRLLFDAARDAEPEDLEAVHSMLLALKRKERSNID